MMAAVVEVCAAFGLIVAEKKTVTMHMRSPNIEADTVEVEAAGQRYEQIKSILYLGGKSGASVISPPRSTAALARRGRASISTAE